jgi:hypothetical protein
MKTTCHKSVQRKEFPHHFAWLQQKNNTLVNNSGESMLHSQIERNPKQKFKLRPPPITSFMNRRTTVKLLRHEYTVVNCLVCTKGASMG